jgi:hypothetical protein
LKYCAVTVKAVAAIAKPQAELKPSAVSSVGATPLDSADEALEPVAVGDAYVAAGEASSA